ncbi:MAG: hypothetical protein JXB36_03150 [Gammaproteobacteria bacterium]|nr:hypothetical protein [Gammaproteobacteria bacterium]
MIVGSVLAAAALGAGSLSAQRAGDCDRACLEGFVDRYLDAMVDDDVTAAPFSANARFTENGQKLELGDALWNTMKSKGTYRLFVTDVEAQQVAFIGTVHEDDRDPEQSVPALFALRLKIDEGEIAEAEQMVVRNAEAAERVEALGSPRQVLLDSVQESERMSRWDMITTADAYFSGMQQNDGKGEYPFAEDCNRLENGMQATNRPTPEGETRPDPRTSTGYSAQWSCLEQFESGLLHFVNRIRDRRYVAVDRERGLVFAFAFFDHSGGDTRTFQTPDGRTVTAGPAQPWTWYIAELFKIRNHEIGPIEAILDRVPYGMNSGWSTYEAGMSDRIQDATR